MKNEILKIHEDIKKIQEIRRQLEREIEEIDNELLIKRATWILNKRGR